MINLVHRLKCLPSYLSQAFFISAVFLIIINIITLIPTSRMNELFKNFSAGIPALFGVLSGGFIVYFVCRNTRKAIAAAGSILFFDLILFSLCGLHISLVFGIVFALIYSFIFEKQSIFWGFVICALLSFITAVLIGLSYEFLFDLLKALCSSLKGRGAVFGAVNNTYSLLFSDNLAELFYHKDYSGSAYSNGKIVSGVIDMFIAQKTAGISASKYLSGKYVVNAFLSTGVLALIYQRLEREEKNALMLCYALALIFGDTRLFALFLLIYNPLMYLGFLLMISISYLTAFLLDIRMVFLKNGSIFEMIKYRDKLGYFLLAGLVLCILTYYFEKIIMNKWDFQSRKVLPYEVRKIVLALGGEKNIESVLENSVILKNPNLIDILKLDCEIHSNKVFLNPDEAQLLNMYF